MDDGRALAVTDWDGDGDLDLWLSNRTGPRVKFLRNDIVDDNQSLTLSLQGVASNRDAIGARATVTVKTNGTARTSSQTVRAGESFLSQSSKTLTFGIANGNPSKKLKFDGRATSLPKSSQELKPTAVINSLKAAGTQPSCR